MKKLVFIFFLLASLLLVNQNKADLQASFTGSRFKSLTRESTIFESYGVVDENNTLIDFSGENNMQYTEAFDNAAWTKTNVTVTANQVAGPFSDASSLNAELLEPTAADSYMYQDDGIFAVGVYTCAFYIRSATGANVNLSIHVYNQTHTAIRGTNAITVTPFWQLFQVQATMIAGDTAVGCTIGGNNTWSTNEDIYAVRAQEQENDEWRTNAGVYHPVATTVIKPALDMAQTNNPTMGKVDYQDYGGNKLEARTYNGANQYYSLAHDAVMNMNDENHTYTFVFSSDSGAGGADVIFSHGVINGSGVYIFVSATYIRAVYSGGGSAVNVDYNVTTNDGYYHIYQLVRTGNNVVPYWDGIAGATYDVTGMGVDQAQVMYVGRNNGGNYFQGDISYMRIDTEALDADDLASDRETLLAIYTNWSNENVWTFDRNTTAYKTFSNMYENTYPSHSMDEITTDIPRVAGRGGGLLIEGQLTQLHGYTEAFNNWIQTGVCAVTADNYDAPNGTTTADQLDNTAGVNTDNRAVVTANLGALGGRTFTGSVWVRAAIPHNITIQVSETGVAATNATYYATTEWQRFTVTRACAGGGAGTLAHRVYPGEAGVATGVAHFWGANLTEIAFDASYIPNAGAATTQVTRNADDMTIDPHPVWVNEYIIPEELGPNDSTSDFTIYVEAKCHWSSSADMGGGKVLIDIGGNAGTATATRNRMLLWVAGDGRLYGYLRDDADVDHYGTTAAANRVDFSEWFSARLYLDLADLSNMEIWLNEDSTGMNYINNNGTATWDTTNNLIRIGQQYNDVINGNCWYRNLRIYTREVQP